MEANMGNINLNFLIVFIWESEFAASGCLYRVIELFADFEKASFYLFFDLRLEFLLHVVSFKFLTLEVLEWMRFFDGWKLIKVL